jgi:hypothetical protein
VGITDDVDAVDFEVSGRGCGGYGSSNVGNCGARQKRTTEGQREGGPSEEKEALLHD